MVQSGNQPPNSSALRQKKPSTSSPRLLRSLPAVHVLGLLLLTLFVGGFVWHDLRGAYHDALAYWNIRLSGSAQDRVRIIAFWLSERRTDAEVIAEDPLTTELLQTPKGRASGAAKLMQRKLQGIEEGRGYVTGLIVDTDCNIVAREGSTEVAAKDLQSSCKSVYRTKRFDVEALNLEKNRVWLSLATPVLAGAPHLKPGDPARHIAGAVILVFAPWKHLYPFVVGDNEPAQSIETQIIWKGGKDALIFLPRREVMHQDSVLRMRLGEAVFGAEVAQENEVPFGEFVDYRGIKVFGAARHIPISGGSLARKIDVDEALADYHRRAMLEGLAGALCILLFGLVILTQHRRTAMQELISKIQQQEALLDLQQQAAVSEARYRNLFENASDAIAMFDLQGQVISLNKAAERAGGYSHTEALKLNFSHLLPPESQDVFERNLERLLAGETSPAEEVELVAKDGRRVPMEASSQLVFERGEPVGVQVIARDVTDRKQSEEALRRSEERFSKAFRSNPELASISTLGQGRYVDVNEAFLRAMGRSREEVIGRTAVELNFWRDPEARVEFLKRLNAEGRVRDMEVHFCAKGGEVRTGLISGEVTEIQGEECLLAVTRDITDRKRMEEALRHREKEFKEAQRLAQIGSWEWDVNSDAVSWSDELYRIARRDPTLPAPHYREFPQIYGPETWERLNPLVENCVKTGDPYELEMERTHPDGTRKWFIARGEPVRDAAGRTVRLRGTVQDITERKQAELALQESEERFRCLSEASFEGIAFSKDGKVIEANTRLTRMLGCEMNELVGSMISDWVAPDSLELVMENVRSGSEGPYENHLRKRDGTTFPVETRARKLPWKGKFVRATTIRDISELKRTEQMLRNLTEGTASVTGPDFFASLVQHSAAALHAKFAFIAESHQPGRARTLAYWDGENSGKNFEYDLKDSPCQGVLQGKTCIFPDTVRNLFPKDGRLARLGAESYLGVPLLDSSRHVIGHLAVIDTRPMREDSQAISILEIFAARAGAELERQRTLQALEGEKAFSDAVIDSLPGFVYVVDTKGEVIRWNKNAETILGYSRDQLSAMNTLNVIAEEDHESVAAKWLEAFARGNSMCEARVVTKHGKKVPFLLSALRADIGDTAYVIGTGIDISERKRAEEALKESEELFRQMAANTPYAFFLWDVRSERHVYVNPAYEAVWGRPPESLYTDVDDWKKAVHPEDRARMCRRVLGEFQSHPEREAIEEEFRIVRPDGSIRWVHMNRFPVRDDTGKVHRIGLVAQDITERKASEETLVKLKKAVDTSGEVIFMTDREGVFTSVNPEFTRLYGYTEQEVVGKATPRILKGGNKTAEEYAELWKTILEKRVFLGEIVNKTKDGRRVDIETSVSAISGDRDEILGFLAIQRDIAERKQAEEALKKSEARYRSLVEDSLALICTHDLDGKLLSVNPAAAKAWGGTAFELVGRKIQELLTPTALTLYPDYIEQLRNDKSGEGLIEVITKTGEVRFWAYRNVLREEAGKEPFVLGYAQDITERKLAEEKLQEEKAFSDAVIDSLPGAFYVTDQTGRMIRWNKNAEKMLGYTSEELAGLGPQVTIAEEDRAVFATKRHEVLDKGQTMAETHVLTKEGKKIPVLLTGMRSVIGGNLYVVGMAIDITDRKRTEEALRESEERFRQMAENSPDMFWLYNVRDEKLLYVSPAFERIWGRSIPELRSNPNIWRNAIHPEDREYILTDFDTVGRTIGSENEYRILWPDGTVRWLHGRVFPIRDESGEVARLAGIVYDVTDRRLAEEALRRQEKLFHAIVEDQTEMIVRWRPDGTRTFVNAAYCNAFGASQGELVGTSFFRFLADEDRERIRQKIASLTPGQPTATDNHRTVTADGSTRWHEWTDHGIFDAQGRLAEIQSIGRDITERKQAVEELTISEARYRTLIETAPEAIVVLEAATGRFVDFNENACHLFGLPGDELLKQTPFEVSPPLQPDSRPSKQAAVEYIERAAAGEVPVFEWMHRNAAGVDIPCEVRLVRLPSTGRTLLRGSVTDITERKKAEEALRASQVMFSRVFHSSPEPMCIIAISDGNFLDVNKAFCDQIGYSREEAVGKSAAQLGLEPLSGLSAEQRESLDQGGLHNMELELRTRSGEVRTALVSFEILEIAGQPCILAQGRDVTEHRQAERALRTSEQRYRDFISHSNEAVWRVELDEAIPIDLPAEEQMERLLHHAFMAECNDALAHIVGATRADEIIGKRLIELIPPTDRVWREGFKSGAAGKWQNRTIQFQVTLPTGQTRHLQRTEIPIIENRKLVRVWGLTRDVTDLYLAEEAVRASEERYRLLFERSLAGVVRTTLDGRVLECNEAFAKIQGCASRQEIISSNVQDFYLEKSDGTTIFDLLKQHPLVIGEEFHTRRREGSPAWMLVSASLIENEREGPSILVTAFDITHWKELGEQLRQSQKMEAVGRLAGGVAHDFNNMLQIINGYSELVIDQLPAPDPLRGHMQEIKGIVERAAGLTRQLLAFSRQQVLAPQVLDLNIAIANLSKMLRRLIGEDIELVMHEGHPLSRVKADPGQIDQVLLNLAVNARDAMPRGGKLTIETANAEIDDSFALAHFPMTPGPYIMIAVTDTGYGMDTETQSRIFEPFFTTKEKGKGTGLGLATVYGIVKQSGGFIWVESEVGKGTTFKVYLPPATEAAAPQRAPLAPSMLQGTETVLLVEDEEYVRSLVRKSLQSKGYTVLEARNGQDALRVSREHHGPIHLLITDVVMPGMSGRELSETLTPLRREMKTLYMSGYADDAILHHGVLQSGSALLQKPFTAEALANTVRHVLEQGQQT